MAAKLMEILEGLRELGYEAYVLGKDSCWFIIVRLWRGDHYVHVTYSVEPGIVSPYRTVESVVREIVEEVKRYGKS